MPPSLLLNLDLATQHVPAESEILAHVSDPNPTILRATDFGAPTSPTGAPSDWNLAADAVFRIAHEVRRSARATGQTPRLFITGRAGLPLFVQLGCLLSARVLEFTLLNRRKDSTQWDSLHFPPPQNPTAHPDNAPFFAVRSGLNANDNPGRIAVTISTNLRRNAAAPIAFLQKKNEPVAAEIELRTHSLSPEAPPVTFLTGENAPKAAAELMDIFSRIPCLFPNANGLALFIDGPITLAFLAGRAIVPRISPIHNNVWIPSFSGGEYRDALRLPHKPPIPVFIVHADEDRAFAERLKNKTLARTNTRGWHTGMLLPGDPVEEMTGRMLNEAKIILVVVSPNTYAHDDTHHLVERALDRMQHQNAKVIPILARHCDWKSNLPRLGALHALPTGNQWLKSATNNDNDEQWAEVERALRPVIDQVRADLFGEEM